MTSRRARTGWLVTGILLTLFGAVLTFPRRRGGGFLLDLDDAAPWAGLIALVGALILLWLNGRSAAPHVGGGIAIPVILCLFVIGSILWVLGRAWGELDDPPIIMGLIGLLLTVAVLAVVAVRSWLRRRRRDPDA